MYAAEAGAKLIAIATIANIYLVFQFCPGTGFPTSINAIADVAAQCGEAVMTARSATLAAAAIGACLIAWGTITSCAYADKKTD